MKRIMVMVSGVALLLASAAFANSDQQGFELKGTRGNGKLAVDLNLSALWDPETTQLPLAVKIYSEPSHTLAVVLIDATVPAAQIDQLLAGESPISRMTMTLFPSNPGLSMDVPEVVGADDHIVMAVVTSSSLDDPSKVTVCHMPPGNTDNPRAITISTNALAAHLEHGDSPCLIQQQVASTGISNGSFTVALFHGPNNSLSAPIGGTVCGSCGGTSCGCISCGSSRFCISCPSCTLGCGWAACSSTPKLLCASQCSGN